MAKTKYQPTADILRISVKYQKYRYAKKTQLFLDLKKYRYVGEITTFEVGKLLLKDNKILKMALL